MKTIITIGGSTSKNSINKKLAEYTGTLLNGNKVVNLNLSDYKLPLYSVDEEVDKGFPEALMKLNEAVSKADGFIISLAEHNGAYAAAFKNVFDWLSRVEAKVWRKKPILLLSTSPGPRGGQSVLEIALNRFPYHDAQITGSLAFPSFFENFNDTEVTNLSLRSELIELVKTFEKAL